MSKSIYDYGKEKKNKLSYSLKTNDKQISAQTKCDELYVCSITKKNWRECHLGLPLVQKLGKLDVIFEYWSIEGFNKKVKTNNNNDIKYFWLPLVINKTNWKYNKIWLISAINYYSNSQKGENTCNSKINIGAILKLIIQVLRYLVQLFYLCQTKNPDNEENITKNIIRYLVNVHHLLLVICKKYPEIRDFSDKLLKNYIFSNMRGDDNYYDVILLLVTAKNIEWDQLKETILLEYFRTIALVVKEKLSPLLNHKNIIDKTYDDDYVFDMWLDSLNSLSINDNYRKLLYYYHLIETLKSESTLDKSLHIYDECWGYFGDIYQKNLSESIRDNCDVNNIITLPDLFEAFDIKTKKENISKLLEWCWDQTIQSDDNFA